MTHYDETHTQDHAERASVTITIGGNLPAHLARPMTGIIHSHGQLADGQHFELTSLRAREPLRLTEHHAPGNVFSPLETFCAAHGLAYVRESANSIGRAGSDRAVFPGFGPPLFYELDDAGLVIISDEIVDRLGILEAIDAHYEQAFFKVPPLVVLPETGA